MTRTTTPPDWDNLSVLHRNTLPSRTHFLPFPSVASALSRDPAKANSILLSGTWKFAWSPNPFSIPPLDEDTTKWDDVTVPSMWQLEAGGKYGKGPQYTNVAYPFPVNPPHPPYLDNETGTYSRTFAVPLRLQGGQLRIRFEGIDSAFHLYINGREVGYSQGSRNPSEFDITEYVDQQGENEVRVRVYQRCDGSYIEDQDQWWLSGIFRDVYLLSFPLEMRIEDVHIHTTFVDDSYSDAILHVTVHTSSSTSVALKLFSALKETVVDTSVKTVNDIATFQIPIEAPYHWTAETPYLYTALLSLPDSSTVISQHICQPVGFRQVEIVGGVLTVNGSPIKFRGVNRHEHHPEFGRAVPYEYMRQDLLLMKRFNINAIRTSHQPNDPRMLDVADELGFWVIDEADLECHGFLLIEELLLTDEERNLPPLVKWDTIYRPRAGKPTSDNSDWKEAYEDRARQLACRDRNHPSVIIWSLGNEAFMGKNFYAMYDLLKQIDPSRLVHYEGDASAGPSDMYSIMYPTMSALINFATKDKEWEKPIVLCEFAHAMGNGPGAIKEYFDAFYEYPRLCGGFVWEWACHGLLAKREDGEAFYGYGGAFGDAGLNDGTFVLSGMNPSNHEVGRGLIELGKAIEPLQVLSGGYDTVEIINRYDFRTLDHLRCRWTLVKDGPGPSSCGFLEVPSGTKPGATVKLKSPTFAKGELLGGGETFLRLEFYVKRGEEWDQGDPCVASGQVELVGRSKMSFKKEAEREGSAMVTELPANAIQIACKRVTWKFDLVLGHLAAWRNNGVELIHTPPILDFYRAMTDNDNPYRHDGKEWRQRKLDLMRTSVTSTNWIEQGGTVEVVVHSRIAPPVLDWGVNVIWTWTFMASGKVHLKIVGTPEGRTLPATFARIGLTLSLSASLHTATWFGRGPDQSYVDMKLSQLSGRWSLPVEDLFTEYEYPQDNGNRTDVSWVEFGDDTTQLKASFGDQEGCSFSASHFSVKDLDDATYPHLLKKKRREEVIVRLDWRHHGLGTGSCGPKTMDKYALNSGPFEFEVWFES